MKIIKLEQAEESNNSEKCKVLEYSFKDKDIDCATAVISGRYPDEGFCVNEVCKELIYVIEGNGTLNKEDEIIEFKKGDAILIDKEENIIGMQIALLLCRVLLLGIQNNIS